MKYPSIAIGDLSLNKPVEVEALLLEYDFDRDQFLEWLAIELVKYRVTAAAKKQLSSASVERQEREAFAKAIARIKLFLEPGGLPQHSEFQLSVKALEVGRSFSEMRASMWSDLSVLESFLAAASDDSKERTSRKGRSRQILRDGLFASIVARLEMVGLDRKLAMSISQQILELERIAIPEDIRHQSRSVSKGTKSSQGREKKK